MSVGKLGEGLCLDHAENPHPTAAPPPSPGGDKDSFAALRRPTWPGKVAAIRFAATLPPEGSGGVRVLDDRQPVGRQLVLAGGSGLRGEPR